MVTRNSCPWHSHWDTIHYSPPDLPPPPPVVVVTLPPRMCNGIAETTSISCWEFRSLSGSPSSCSCNLLLSNTLIRKPLDHQTDTEIILLSSCTHEPVLLRFPWVVIPALPDLVQVGWTPGSSQLRCKTQFSPVYPPSRSCPSVCLILYTRTKGKCSSFNHSIAQCTIWPEKLLWWCILCDR